MDRRRMVIMGGAAVPRFSLYDTFTTNKSAGEVHGTTSESPYPTGGGIVRTVIDTESKLTITSGKLTFAGGKASPQWCDPGLTYPSVTRTVGKMWFFRVDPSNTSAVMVGYHNAAMSAGTPPAQGAYYLSGAVLYWYAVAGYVKVLTPTYPLREYRAMIVLRASGAHLFIKGEEYTQWTKVWSDSRQNAATLYAHIANNTFAGTVDDPIFPESLWLPEPLVSDGFSGWGTSDGLGHAEGVAGGLGSGGSGKTWTTRKGTIGVSGGRAKASAVDGTAYAGTPAAVDMDITAKFWVGTTGGGFLARYVDANNYISVQLKTASIEVVKMVAGTPTTLINQAVSPVAGAELRLRILGTTLYVHYNNAIVGSEQTVSDAALQTSAEVGVWFADTDTQADDLYIYPGGSGGEYAALNKY